MEEQMKPVRIFIYYAREDREHVENLRRHLATLRQLKKADIWYDGEILPGAQWEQEITDHLNTADIVLLLVSADFLDLFYCYETEMKRALERHKADQIVVIPIIIRHVDIEGTPFSTFQMLPAEAKPVIAWTHKDEAYADIAKRLRLVVEQVVSQRSLPKEEQVSSLDSASPTVKMPINTLAPGRMPNPTPPNPGRLPNPSLSLSNSKTPIQGGIYGESPTPIQGGIYGEAPGQFEAFSTEDSVISERFASFLKSLFQIFGKQKKDVLGIIAPDPTPREQITAPDPTLFPTHQRPGPPTDLFPTRQRPRRPEPSYPSAPNPGPPLAKGGQMQPVSVPAKIPVLTEPPGSMSPAKTYVPTRPPGSMSPAKTYVPTRPPGSYSEQIQPALASSQAQQKADYLDLPQSLTHLTRREREVVRLLERGLNNNEIAQNLSISPKTARNYVANISRKLGIADRTQFILSSQEGSTFSSQGPEQLDYGKQKKIVPGILAPDPTGVPRLPMSNRPVVNSYGKPYSMGMTLYEYGDHFDEVLALSWSPNGQYIASGGKEIHIWEVVTGKCVAVYKGHTRLVRAIKWFSDRNCIASSDNYEAHIWNINMALINNRLLDDLSPHLYLKIPIDPQFIQNSSDIPTAFDLSPDSLQIIFGGKTYNSFTGNFLFDLGSAEETPCSAVYSPDGKYIAAGYQNAKVAIYSTVNGCSIDTSQRSETNLVTALAWSADGQYVAYGGSNRMIHLWHPHLNPFEPYLESGSGPNGQNPPFRHLAPGEIPDAFTYFHNSEAIIALKFSSDGHYLASLTRDNVIKILKPFKWFLLYTKKGYPHLMNSNSIAWSPDSASIASISEGMTIEVWQTYVDARSKPAPLFFTKLATTPSNEESLRQSVQTKIKAHNRLMKTNIGALVVYGKDSQITQRVFVVSHQKLKNYPLVERDLYKLEAKEIERMQLLAHSRLPNPTPGVLCAKSQPIKCYTLKGQYIYAAVFEDLAPDDYLVWIDANNPVSVPVFSHQAASIDWYNTVSPKPSISPSAYEQQDK